LLERSGAVRVRSDVERQRLFGPEGRYDESATAATYRRLADVAADGVRAGWDVIVDAAFLRREQRDAMRRVAADAGVAFAILDCQAPMAVLRERVHDRHAAGIDASEADVAVLEHLARVGEPLGPDERAHTVAVSTDEPVAVADLLRRWGRPAATSAESR
jgi:hypothetical protein